MSDHVGVPNSKPDAIETSPVTATVTSDCAPSGRAPVPTTAEFLASVLPVPGPENPGFVNLHYSMVASDGKLITGAGWPYTKIESLLDRAAWCNDRPNFKGVWFCTSSQRSAGTNAKGKPKAIRLHKNVLAVKAIWVDVDVKPEDATGKHYLTMGEAWDAITAFRKKVGLPQFSAAVNSGGGLHIYWISDKPLDPAEWATYAAGLKALLLREGVKCDAGLTTDDVRLLRLPGTFNHKYVPPREVKLLPLPLVVYDFSTSLGFLTPPVTMAVTPAAPYSPFFEGVDPAAFGRPAFTIDDGSTLGPSTESYSDHSALDPSPVFEQCGFMKEAVLTGGRDFGEPLWNLSVLTSTFLENGRGVAHQISHAHAGYSPAETDAKYDQKVAVKATGGVGWPSCATIQGAGCKSCALCPHLLKGKSPLHLTGPVTVTVIPGSTTAGPATWSPANTKATFANIRHRRTLYGHDLVRGEITILGSPGGVGKSSLAIGMGVSIVAGQELLDEKIRGNGLKVLLINAEDSTDEIRRRIWAFSLAHSVAEVNVSRLYLAGADDPRVQRLSFLRTNQKGYSELDTAGLAELRSALQSLAPDVIILDPLVALCTHGNMNDNPSMSLVMRALKGLAAEFDCAILIVAHTSKAGEAGAANAVSGAASIVNLARRAIMPVTLSAEEAIPLGILLSERLRHFKLIDAKSNLAPRSTDYRCTVCKASNCPTQSLRLIRLGTTCRPLFGFNRYPTPRMSGRWMNRRYGKRSSTW